MLVSIGLSDDFEATPIMNELEKILSHKAKQLFQPENLLKLKNEIFDGYTFLELTYLANMLYVLRYAGQDINSILVNVDVIRILKYEKLSVSLEMIENIDHCLYNMFYQMNVGLIKYAFEKIRQGTYDVKDISSRDLNCIKERMKNDSSIKKVDREFILKEMQFVIDRITSPPDYEYPIAVSKENLTMAPTTNSNRTGSVWKFIKKHKLLFGLSIFSIIAIVILGILIQQNIINLYKIFAKKSPPTIIQTLNQTNSTISSTYHEIQTVFYTTLISNEHKMVDLFSWILIITISMLILFLALAYFLWRKENVQLETKIISEKKSVDFNVKFSKKLKKFDKILSMQKRDRQNFKLKRNLEKSKEYTVSDSNTVKFSY